MYEQLGKDVRAPAPGEDPPDAGTPADLLDDLRREIAEFLGVEEWGEVRDSSSGIRSKLRPGLIQAYISVTGDPDVDLPEWLRHGAPLGLNKVIQHRGIFPRVLETSGSAYEFRNVTARIRATKFRNYMSFYDPDLPQVPSR